MSDHSDPVSRQAASVSVVMESMTSSSSSSGSIAAWSLHFPQLVRIAHATLGNLPYRLTDAEDAAQSAMISFWQHLQREGLNATLDRNSLWGLLATIAARKALQLVRRQRAQKRGGGRDVSLEAIQGGQSDVLPSELLAQTSTRDFDLACEERLEQLPAELRPFAMLRLFSHTNAEIAELLGCSERRVERKLHLIRSYWLQQS